MMKVSRTPVCYFGMNSPLLRQYVLTIVLSRPSQFKYAALASFISVVLGAFTYVGYVKRERGHVFHHDVGASMMSLLKRQ